MGDLTDVGLADAAAVYHNLSTPALFEEIVRRREGRASQGGALVVRTGEYTGRSPGDKFIVEEPSSREHIWWGDALPCDLEHLTAPRVADRLESFLGRLAPGGAAGRGSRRR